MSVVNSRTLRHFSLGVIALSLAACGGSEEPTNTTAHSAGYFETSTQTDSQAEPTPAEVTADHSEAERADKPPKATNPLPGLVTVQYGTQSSGPLEMFNLSQSMWIRSGSSQMRYEITWRWNEWRRGRLWIESDVVKEDGSTGDVATFGVFGANGSSGPNCGPVNGDPTIRTCTIPTSITDRSYHRLFVWRLDADAQGQWWGAWVVNRGKAHWIGSIRTPGNSSVIPVTPSVSSEYRGGRIECDDVPRSSVIFYNTVGNRRSSFNSDYVFRVSRVSGGDCPGENVIPLWDRRMVLLNQGVPPSP